MVLAVHCVAIKVVHKLVQQFLRIWHDAQYVIECLVELLGRYASFWHTYYIRICYERLRLINFRVRGLFATRLWTL